MDDDVLDWEDDDEYATNQLNLPSAGDTNGAADDEGDDAVSLGGDEEEQEYYGTRTDFAAAQNNNDSHERAPSMSQTVSLDNQSSVNGHDATAPPALGRVKSDSRSFHAPSSPPKPPSQNFTHALPPKPVLASFGRPPRPLLTEATSMTGNLPPKRQSKASDLLPDWEEKTSSNGDVYYYNVLTHVSQWPRPTVRASTPPPIGYESSSASSAVEDRYHRNGSSRKGRTEAVSLPSGGHSARGGDSWVAPDVRSRSPGDEKYSDRQTGSRRRESRRSRRHDVDYPKDRRQSPAETEKSDKHWVAATDHTSTILEPPVEPSRSQDGQDAFALALSKVRLDAQGIKRQDTRVVQESLPPPRSRSPSSVQQPLDVPISSQPRQRQSRFGPSSVVVQNTAPPSTAQDDPLVPEEFITLTSVLNPAPARLIQNEAAGGLLRVVDDSEPSEAPRPKREPLPPQSAKFRNAVKPPAVAQTSPPPPKERRTTPPRSPEISPTTSKANGQRALTNGVTHVPTEPRRLPDNIPIGPRSQIPLSRPEPSAPTSMYPNRPAKDKMEERPREPAAHTLERQPGRPGRGRETARPKLSGTNSIPIGARKSGASNGRTQSPSPTPMLSRSFGQQSPPRAVYPNQQVRDVPPRLPREAPVDHRMDTYIPQRSPQDQYRRSPEPRDRRLSPRRRTLSPPPRHLDSYSDRHSYNDSQSTYPARESVSHYQPYSSEPIRSPPLSHRNLEHPPNEWDRQSPILTRGYAPLQDRPHGLPMKPVQALDYPGPNLAPRSYSPDQRRPPRNMYNEGGVVRQLDDDRTRTLDRSPHDERRNKSLLDRLSGDALHREDDTMIPRKRALDDSRHMDIDDHPQGGGRNGRKKRRRGAPRN